MLKLIKLTFLLSLSACSSDFWTPAPPCEDAGCVQARIQMMQYMLGNIQQSNIMVEQSLLNTQNNLALIGASSHLEVPRTPMVPMPLTTVPFGLHVVGE